MTALQASRNAHILSWLLRFESACALPSGVLRGFETTSIFSGSFCEKKRVSQSVEIEQF